MKKMIIIIMTAILLIIVSVYAYFGGVLTVFGDILTVNIQTENQGGETIVYERVIGDYRQTPQYTDKIYYALLKGEKIETDRCTGFERIETTRGIGVFYDNPRNVDKMEKTDKMTP